VSTILRHLRAPCSDGEEADGQPTRARLDAVGNRCRRIEQQGTHESGIGLSTMRQEQKYGQTPIMEGRRYPISGSPVRPPKKRIVRKSARDGGPRP